ncbi:Fic family protein [Streptosporangium sp. NBC_01810]|uniref:Fic family protein n=1 Tax=Streptosporangium sp. NBC_01810 TaxID=2975951 RepID=UPI002DDABEF1|nr:Fic family protein [Streptosporangium sp. NBC_01810]WSA23654.1 Fic family protein [Streptosporangium sp. NBC_01810]
MKRSYEESHPWLKFRLDIETLDHETWMLLGEAISKCEHIAGVPLQPEVARELNSIYLARGAHGTTQIEGNTLSEEEVRKVVDDKLGLPSSQAYLEQEVKNVVDAYNLIVNDVAHGRSLNLTPDRIAEFNRMVLRDLPAEENVVPGEISLNNVMVGNSYRGAPREDCVYLLDRLCDWLQQLSVDAWKHEQYRQPVAILSAIMAHLYLAWIHPYGNGNGRTARLMEFQMLVKAGVPTLAAHVMSDFYNRTRGEYYRVLAATSRERNHPIEKFIKYALQGFVDELREQITTIRSHQLGVMWVNYVYEMFHDKNTPACIRQRKLLLDLPTDRITARAKVQDVSPDIARAYAGHTPKLVSRDLNALHSMGLVKLDRRGVRPNVELMQAFLALRAEPEDPNHQSDVA